MDFLPIHSTLFSHLSKDSTPVFESGTHPMKKLHRHYKTRHHTLQFVTVFLIPVNPGVGICSMLCRTHTQSKRLISTRIQQSAGFFFIFLHLHTIHAFLMVVLIHSTTKTSQSFCSSLTVYPCSVLR